MLRSRAGYCEQFAAAMAVLARAVDIPSRVAIGYTGGTSVSGRWNVRTHDSHAWPELYFEGAGWLRFEPTPSGPAGQGTATRPPYTFPEVTTGGDDEPTAQPSAGPTGSDTPTGAANNRRNPLLDQEFGGTPITVDEGMPTAAKIGIGAVVVVLLLLVPAMLRWEQRARRRRVYSRPAVVVGSAGEGPGGAPASWRSGATGARPGWPRPGPSSTTPCATTACPASPARAPGRWPGA
nr:hypothetical protein GCM10020093_114940 [Planobispora longispora]